MKLLLISIRDRAIDAYQPIGNARALGEALRLFRDLVAQQGTPQNAHPDDYDLYVVGEFDDQTGLIESEGPQKIADGKTTKEMINT